MREVVDDLMVDLTRPGLITLHLLGPIIHRLAQAVSEFTDILRGMALMCRLIIVPMQMGLRGIIGVLGGM